MVLSDGGVYDNMADQWPVGIHSRRQRWPSRSSELRVPTELVVVNASGPSGWTSVWRLGLPGAGEIFSMARVIRVLYEKRRRPGGLASWTDSIVRRAMERVSRAH